MAPFLVVASTSVAPNWGAEAARFEPELRVEVMLGTLAGSGRAIEQVANCDVLITTYALFRSRSTQAAFTCHPVRCPYTLGVRTQRLELRLTDEERSTDQAAAAAVGESLSDFFRRAAANRAADVLADQRRIALTEDEAIRFLDALETVDDHTVARLADLRART